jgi:hypothetical protein
MSNSKYITPFANDDKQVKMYSLNNIKLNSETFVANNPYPQTRSYGIFASAYQHYLVEMLERKKNEIEEEKLKLYK